MGVSFGDIIPKNEIEMKDLIGKIIGVDAFNTLYQFLSIIRQPDGTPLKDSKGHVTSHLSGILYRNANLIENGIKVVYVFDGEAPKFKHRTQEERRNLRAQAAEKWKEAVEAGDVKEARKHAMMSTSLDKESLKSAKDLLHALGIPIVQAPSEGEAQLAHMCASHAIYAAASQDMDSILFGAPILVRNLNVSGKRKIPRKQTYIEVKPEMIKLEGVLKNLGINREQLIAMAILVGNDYDEGIPGIGPKKALAIIKRHGTLQNALEETGWPYEIPAEEIMNFFLNPPVQDTEVTWHKPDFEKAKKILCDDHDFSEERVDKALERYASAKANQSSLQNFFRK